MKIFSSGEKMKGILINSTWGLALCLVLEKGLSQGSGKGGEFQNNGSSN